MTAEKSQTEVLHKLWEWAKDVLTPELNSMLFLAKDEEKMTAWHIAAYRVQI